MSYTTTDRVAARSPGRIFTATSKPSATQAGYFIEDTAAQLDGILSERGYSVPVPSTATVSFALLRDYNTAGAHCLVEKSAPTGRDSDMKDACAAWEAAKKALSSGAVDLPDATTLTTGDSLGRTGYQPTAMFPATSAY